MLSLADILTFTTVPPLLSRMKFMCIFFSSPLCYVESFVIHPSVISLLLSTNPLDFPSTTFIWRHPHPLISRIKMRTIVFFKSDRVIQHPDLIQYVFTQQLRHVLKSFCYWHALLQSSALRVILTNLSIATSFDFDERRYHSVITRL